MSYKPEAAFVNPGWFQYVCQLFVYPLKFINKHYHFWRIAEAFVYYGKVLGWDYAFLLCKLRLIFIFSRADHHFMLHVCSGVSFLFWLRCLPIALHDIWEEPAGFR